MRRRAVALALALAATGAGAGEPAAFRPFDAASWRALRAAHAGRPTLVHFWGMTCGPCRTEMPRLGQVLAAHPGVDVVTVDTDEAGGAVASADAALAFLRQSAMPLADAWRFADPFAARLFYAVDSAWQGEVPMTVLLARDGTVTRHVGAADPAALEAWFAAQVDVKHAP